MIKQNKIENSNNKVIDVNSLNDLKKNASIKWNSWATLSIIEFSDLECPYCIIQHNSWTYNKILENNKDDINFIFKNFPLPSHKNASKEAEAGKCVEKIAWSDKYFEFVDNIFSTTKWGWEGYNLEELPTLAEKIGLDKNTFNECYLSWTTLKQVEKEFVQARLLWINSAPTTLIINNETWEYKIISWVVDNATLEKSINEIKSK